MVSFSSNPRALSLLEVIVRARQCDNEITNQRNVGHCLSRQLGYKSVLVVDLQECPTNPPFLFAV